jgi:protocatechuate 3,4-dioxygenase beta subunit
MVDLVETAVVTVPPLVGWVRPVILLPAGALAGLPAAQHEAVLAHELAHVRRHDYLVNLLQSAVEVLLFYHPVTWWLSHRVRVEREHCCDDIAAACCASRVAYARALVELESRRIESTAPGLAATDGPLAARVRRLLRRHEARPTASPVWLVAAVVLGTLAIAIVAERGVTATPGPQTPTVTASAAVPDDEAVVRGRVVDARTGAPIAGARVSMAQAAPLGTAASAPPGAPGAVTGDDGRFEMTGVVPFEYVVEARAEGYISRFFGQPMGGPRGILVAVRGGRVVSDIDFALDRTGVVSGRVLDGDGDGVTNVEVELLAQAFRAGGAGPVAVGFAQTEEGGLFRVRNVPPGQYLVRAYAPGTLRPDPDDPSGIFASTFFPGVTEVGGAQWLQLASGQELFGVDFELTTTRARTVSGTLIDPGGPALEGMMVELWSPGLVVDSAANPTGAEPYPSAAVEADGTFVIEDVHPGLHSLMVVDRSARQRGWPRLEVPVTDGDVRDLQVVAEDPARVDARFVDGNGRPLPFDASELGIGYVSRMRAGYIQIGGGYEVEVSTTGTFDVYLRPGNVEFSVRNVPQGWVLQGFRADGADLPADAVDILPGDLVRLDVMLTDRVSRVTGLVTDDDARPVPRALVLLFPTDRDGWGAERRTHMAYADQDGRYRFEGLVAGDYQVIALEALARGAQLNRDVIEQLWSQAVSVRLLEDQERGLPLTLTPQPPGVPRE